MVGGVFLSYDIEPFLPSLLSHNSSPSAYPPSRSKGLLPLNLYFSWSPASSDRAFHDAIRASAAAIKAKAIALGQDVANAFVYSNYALFSTPLENIYGQNLPRLRSIKEQYDPRDVMGLAGGFRLGQSANPSGKSHASCGTLADSVSVAFILCQLASFLK